MYLHKNTSHKCSTSIASHYISFTAKIYIFQAVGLPGFHIGFKTLKKNRLAPATHVSSLLWVLIRLVSFIVLGLILSFSSKVFEHGKFIHEMVRLACPKVYCL